MPKTKDAFALRDFDAKRIWKQKFFGGTEVVRDFPVNVFWCLPEDDDVAMYEVLKSLWERPQEVTDEEILDGYCNQAMEFQKNFNYARGQRIIDIFKTIYQEVVGYLGRISRHSKRLERYSKIWNETISADETLSAAEIRTRTRRIQILLKSYSDVQCAINNLQNSIAYYLSVFILKYKKIDSSIFAIRLRQARTEAGYTQARMAEKIGMSQSTYTNYENFKCEPPLMILKSLARELGRSADWLLGLTP